MKKRLKKVEWRIEKYKHGGSNRIERKEWEQG